MRNAKKTLSLVMIAIFTTFIVLSGIPASAAVSAAAAKKQVSTATTLVVKAETIVKVATFNVTTAQNAVNAAAKEVVKVKALGKTYLATYNKLVARDSAVSKKIATKRANDAKIAAAAKATLTNAVKAVDKAESLTNTDTYDLEGNDTDLANAQEAITNALEAIVKLSKDSADYKGLMARVDAANAKVVAAMDAREDAANKIAHEKQQAEAVAAAETAVKAVEALTLATADDLAKALAAGKTAATAVAAVEDATKVADFTARLKVVADKGLALQAKLDKEAADKKAAEEEAKKPATIVAVSAVDGTITVTFNKKPITTVAAVDFTITKSVNGAASENVTPGTITVTGDNTVTIAVPAIAAGVADQKVVYTVTYTTGSAVSAIEYTVAKVPALTVSSVTALNARELKVVFNTAVDETSAEIANNYTLTGGLHPAFATLQADGVSVVLQLAAPMANGNTYKVDAANVLNKFYQKMAAYTDTAKLFADITAPQLLSVSYTGSKVKLVYNEPINTANIIVKVDGTVIAAGNIATAKDVLSADTALDYSVTATVALTAGAHTVVVYSATDDNANATQLTTTSLTVAVDTTIPKVVSTTAVGAKAIDVQFNKAVLGLDGQPLTTANIVVMKGSHTYSAANGDFTFAVDGTDATLYHLVMTTVDASNPVFATGENSTNLNIAIKNFTDASGYIGAAFNATVTVSTDTAAPYVVSNILNTATVGQNTIVIHFNENLGGATASYITVKDADGILQPITNVAVNNKDLTITLQNNVAAKAYTIALAPGAVTDVAGNSNAVTTTSIDKTALAGAFDVANGAVTVTGNVISIDYSAKAADMTSSAVDLSNYTLDGVAFPAGTSIGFVGDKQHVQITLPAGVFAANTQQQLVISKNVVSADGAWIVKDAVTGNAKSYMVAFTDNVKPVLVSAKYIYSVGATSTTTIRLTFSEAMTATALNDVAVGSDFKVTVAGVTLSVLNANSVVGDAKSIDLTIANPVNVTQAGTVIVKSSTDEATIDAKDANNNTLTRGTVVTIAQ